MNLSSFLPEFGGLRPAPRVPQNFIGRAEPSPLSLRFDGCQLRLPLIDAGNRERLGFVRGALFLMGEASPVSAAGLVQGAILRLAANLLLELIEPVRGFGGNVGTGMLGGDEVLDRALAFIRGSRVIILVSLASGSPSAGSILAARPNTFSESRMLRRPMSEPLHKRGSRALPFRWSCLCSRCPPIFVFVSRQHPGRCPVPFRGMGRPLPFAIGGTELRRRRSCHREWIDAE